MSFASSILRKPRSLDWHLLLLAGVILFVGLAFVWSATQTMDKTDGLAGQLTRMAMSLPCFLLGLLLPASWFRRNALALYAISILLVIAVYFVGREINGARRWFSIAGVFTVQPSEFVKLTLVLVLAKVLMARRKLERVEGLVFPALLLGLPLILIMRQPDLGTALVLIPVWFAILYVAGAKKRQLLILGLLGLALAPAGYFVLKPYQRERVDVWLRQDSLTSAEKRSQGYHLYNAKLSIGSGGWVGKGLGRGPQNQLNYLPERHTDFIAALIGEEAGFLGTSAVLLLYLVFVGIIFGIAMRLREPFSRLAVVGIGAYFMTHLFVNVGVASGLLPTTGVTLPLISYGGSSTMTAFAALGLVLNLGSSQEPEYSEQGFE